ncbi:hypothetical protein [Facklamia miroungae]|uniref:Helix-turn-helix domain-containing protein n=1 Tax=Facklamia miroungae TaxID=120956 RepID=A0A1G7VBZ4_9LACT|nr:hypothetical protein [Facklamia miroungae]NKZ30292.1 hypothetical protein [Facklamia miroungae]SDG56859.1 hypothetical protein SAMN05421791_1173 [Facklamia miroungae]
MNSDSDLIEAINNNDYESVFKKLKPLYYKNLQGVPSNLHEDLLQEFYILTIKIIDKHTIIEKDFSVKKNKNIF